MKRYCVAFTEKVCYKYTGTKYNKETKQWENNVPCEKWDTDFEFGTLREAKKFIKQNIDKYKGSSIYKFWANGDFENLGEINLQGSNKTFVANTKQKKANY